MPTNRPSDDQVMVLRRQAFLLAQLNAAPNSQLSRTASNDRIPKPIRDELDLVPSVADATRATMLSQGLVREVGGRTVAYSITDLGRTWLREQQIYVPLKPTRGNVIHASEPEVQQSRIAYLLLQLVDTSDDGHLASVLNKKFGPGRLELNAATARAVRGELVLQEFVAVKRTSRSEKYQVTTTGLAYLATLSFDSLGTLNLTGTVLSKLLKAARTDRNPSFERETPSISVLPSSGELEVAVMEIFSNLRRELNTKLVPIHVVRSAIEARWGKAAAAHSVLDEVILSLRRTKQLRLISISDKSRVTAEQLGDSIVSVGETFFYLEKVDESASG